MAKRKIKVNPTIHDIFDDFGEWTSIHAIPHVALADTVCIAFFWIIVFLVCACIMIYMIYNSFSNFLSYPTTLTSRQVSGQQDFPCVTVCNGSPWRLSGAGNTPLADLIDAYNAGATSSQFGFEKPFTMKDAMRAKTWTQFMYEDLKAADENGTATLTYDFLEDLMISCDYLQASCDFTGNIDYFYDAYFGKCAIINSNASWITTRAGPNQGMRLFVKTPVVDYLPWVQTEGVVFYVHGTNETPFEDAFGYYASVGHVSSVGVVYFDRQKLGHPYSNCVEKSTNQNNYYSNDYEVEACLRSCLQDEIIKECECYDPQYNYPSDVTVPSCYNTDDPNTAMDCTLAIVNSLDTSANGTFDINSCDCLPSCDLSYYQISMSTATWPAKTYTPAECLNTSISSPYWNSTSTCIDWYKRNTWINLVADSGGQLGLWLGMSVISVVELLILAVIAIAYMIVKPKSAELVDYDYFEEFNKELKKQQKELVGSKHGTVDLPPPVTEPAPVIPITDITSTAAQSN
ncbi:unnamed protein product [Bursaphelenchus okinawaensis]|uniref:Uncharacterized protein n=1 Tax=Bursaphelenchus okinawaensis TaxID=465554 RepID=A0A811KDN4_9BILA|nr:unnamed protein product [Bursaphelenchus okinawaensis]CAG9098533.1 unnamed protein product [Bursaphelenchus okinawaensis]